MKTIKLYIKTHNETGLKYFGKTIQDDVHKYKGSGKYWTNHIKKHGYNVTTIILKEFYEDDPKLQEYAWEFSRIYDITNSRYWANLKPENGIDGGWDHFDQNGHKVSEETRQKISQSNMGRIPYNKGEVNIISDKTRQKMSISAKRKIFTNEHRDNMSKSRLGKITSEETKEKISNSNKGKKRTKTQREKMSKGQKSRPLIECPYCKLKSNNTGNMNRWHFDNCKTLNS